MPDKNISECRCHGGASNGITYYGDWTGILFSGDTRQSCGLSPNQINTNFYTLRINDISGVTFTDNALILTRYDGSILSATTKNINEISPNNFKIEYDENTQTLKITYPSGEINNLKIRDIVIPTIYKDYTLKGDGSHSNPLGVSEIETTGMYSPADAFYNLTTQEEIDDFNKAESALTLGYRIITKETKSNFGLLYTYPEVEQIINLLGENSSWRVPTRKDWMELFKAIDCDEINSDGTIGEVAGFKLKSAEKLEKKLDTTEEEFKKALFDEEKDKNIDDIFLWRGYSDDVRKKYPDISDDVIGEISGDTYGFNALPVGWGTDRGTSLMNTDKDIEGIREGTTFWSSTYTSINNAKSIAVEEIAYSYPGIKEKSSSEGARRSLRLVKDMSDISEISDEAEILGTFYPTTHIVVKDDSGTIIYDRLWTAVNFAYPIGSKSIEWEKYNNTAEVYYLKVKYGDNKWKAKQLKEGDRILIRDIETEEGKHKKNHVYQVSKNEKGYFILDDLSDDEIQSGKTYTIYASSSAETFSNETSSTFGISGDTYTPILNYEGKPVFTLKFDANFGDLDVYENLYKSKSDDDNKEIKP